MKRTPQSNPFNNAEPVRVPIVGEYPDELQPVNQAKPPIIFSQSEASISQLPQKAKITNNEIWKDKSGYTRTTAPCDLREYSRNIVSSKGQEKAHTSIIPDPNLIM